MTLFHFTFPTMRLLHAKTFKLHNFTGDGIPAYAILSHRWNGSEITFSELESECGVEIARANTKVAGCCDQAMKDGLDYVVRASENCEITSLRKWKLIQV